VSTPIRLPPSTGTTGTQAAFQPNKPAAVAAEQPAPPPDGFSADARAPDAQLTGLDSARAPGQLVSDLKQVKDPAKLAAKLAGDLKVQLPQLTGLLNLTREQKASRLVEFLVPYASKLAELKQLNPLPQAQSATIEQQLLEPMKVAGLAHVVETTTGKSGVEIGRELLRAATAEEARTFTEGMKFDSPGRPEAAASRPTEPQLTAQPQLQLNRELRHEKTGEAPQGSKAKPRKGKLGKNMLFNVLHLMRDDAATLSEKEKLEAGIVTIALISLVIAVAVAITMAIY
jgi:hypothetical protein